jgi:hypothetical protein
MLIFLFIKNKTLTSKINYLSTGITKIQSLLRARGATNAIAENTEIIYQDLLQQLISIANAADIKPRNTAEHPLWQIAGAIMDEYAKNPYVLEQIRRAIKLDSSVARAAEIYNNHAMKFLEHLESVDTDGLLTSSFRDGLLGQTMTLLAQALALAE